MESKISALSPKFLSVYCKIGILCMYGRGLLKGTSETVGTQCAVFTN